MPKIITKTLQFLVDSGRIFYFLKVDKDSHIDHSGIDFLIFPENKMDWAVPLQVKSSPKGMKEHKQYAGSYGIPCVVVNLNLPPSEIADDLLKAMGLSTDRLEFLLSSLREKELMDKLVKIIERIF